MGGGVLGIVGFFLVFERFYCLVFLVIGWNRGLFFRFVARVVVIRVW